MKNISINELRNIKETNAQYLSGAPNVTPICEVCHQEITKKQDVKIIRKSIYCSKECEYISLLFDPLHQKFKDITSKVNHLIHEHDCDPKTLEAALNSDVYKKQL